ncbi:DUF202 domain-containing protein [Streptomyces celluloflavus]|uniref:DUF202 domain-containing protein n=1 Tax=Streptomyces celluloflavus TaxID=58344 RepID=UPI0036DACA2C
MTRRPAPRTTPPPRSRPTEPAPRPPWDPGLQPERTALAWQRTVLSQITVALGLAHVTSHHSLPLTVALLLVALPLTAVLLHAVSRRAARTDRQLRSTTPLRQGRLPYALTALTVTTGIAALAFLVVSG